MSATSMRGAVDLSSLRNRPVQPSNGAQPDGQPAPDGAVVPALVLTGSDQAFAQLAELSRTVPVILDASGGALTAQLTAIVEALEGRAVLATVDIAANPGIEQFLAAQRLPAVIALVAGRPVPLFDGPTQDAQVRDVFGQLLQLAAQNGVAGQVTVDGGPDGAPAPERELPPLHAEAFEAIEAGDYPRAIAAYQKALAENPRDADARAGLGQVRLLDRVTGADLQEARAAAAANPTDVDAQLLIADLDVSGGHVDDAFARLLDLFQQLPSDARTPVRERLLELFGVVGDDDPRVAQARSRLASLLF